MATALLGPNQYHVDKPDLFLKSPHESSFQDASAHRKQMIGEALLKRAGAINHEVCEPGEEDTFFVADLGDVYRQYVRWKKNLPRIKPFYGKLVHSRFSEELRRS